MSRWRPQPLPIGGGVNLLQDQRFIRDDQVVRSKNWVPSRAGMGAKRGAIDALDPVAVSGGGFYYQASLCLPPANFGSGLVHAQRRFDGLTTDQTVVFVSAEVFPATALASATWGAPSQHRPLILNSNRRIYTFADPNNIIMTATPAGVPAAVGRYGAIIQEVVPGGALEVIGFDFYTDENETTTTQLDAVPRVACNYRNRVVWADFGAGYENVAVMSDPDLPRVVGVDFLAANGRNFTVGAKDGDRIVAAREMMLTAVGSPSQSALLFLREYSAYLFTGEPNLVKDGDFVIGDFTQNRINVDCGCASADTLVNTPYGLLWASYDDVWLFPQGQGVPFRVGSNIRPLLANTPPELRYLWHAAYFDGFYRIHIFSPGQNQGDRTRLGEEWRLDLRYGPPRSHEEARWYGPMIYLSPDPNVGSSDDDDPGVVGVDELLDEPPTFADPGVAYAVADTRPGIVPRLLGITRGGSLEFMGQFEHAHVRDYQSLSALAIFGPDVIFRDTEIIADWQSKEYDQGDPMIEKGYSGAEANFWMGALCRLTIEDLIDGGRTSETSNEDLPQAGFLLDVDVLDTGLLTREYQSVRFESAESGRPSGRTHQFRLYDHAGYVISDANNAPVFVHGGNTFTAALTNGLYDNKELLLNHIVAQMLAISGIVFTHNQTGAGLDNAAAITAASGTWTYGLGTTVSKRLWSILGYDTSAAPAAAGTQTASSVIFYREAALLELANLNVLMYPVKRRPT